MAHLRKSPVGVGSETFERNQKIIDLFSNLRLVYLTSENSPELLNTTEFTFGNILPLVQLLIVLSRLLPVALRQNHRAHPARLRPASILLMARLVPIHPSMKKTPLATGVVSLKK